MGSPRFVSPGAMGGNAIEEFLMKQAMAKRQAQMDALQQQTMQQQSARQDAALALQQQQEQRIAEDRDAAAITQQEQFKQGLMDKADARGMNFMTAEANNLARAQQAKDAQAAQMERTQETNTTRQLIAGMAGQGASESRAIRDQLAADKNAREQEKFDTEKATVAAKQTATQDASRQQGKEMFDIVDRLVDDSGTLKPYAQSVVGWAQGGMPDWLQPNQSALADIKRVTAQGVLDKLKELKAQSRTGATGMGALSEKELDQLINSFSSLANRRQDEVSYGRELKRVKELTRKMMNGGATATPDGPAPPAQGPRKIGRFEVIE